MEKKASVRLIQCIVVPFVGMFAAGRLTDALLTWLGGAAWVSDFGSFLVGALTASFLYRCLDPDHWSNAFRETAAEPCSLPMAAAHVGYSLLWLTAVMYAVLAVFPVSGDGTSRDLAGSIFSAVLVHPILEEWLFRRVFLSRLLILSEGDVTAEVVPDEAEPVPDGRKSYTRAGMLFAVLTQAVLFGLMHTGGGGMLYGFAGGIILGVLMLRTGRLWVPVTVHMLINLRSVLWPILPQEVSFAADIALTGIGLVCGACFWIHWIREEKRPEHGHNRREDAS